MSAFQKQLHAIYRAHDWRDYDRRLAQMRRRLAKGKGRR